jgi:hypothetical protein
MFAILKLLYLPYFDSSFCGYYCSRFRIIIFALDILFHEIKEKNYCVIIGSYNGLSKNGFHYRKMIEHTILTVIALFLN